MEFNDHETDEYYIDVEPLQATQNHKRRRFSQPQLSIAFVYQENNVHANISENCHITLVDQFQLPSDCNFNSRATFRFDLRVSGNPDFAHTVLSPKLSSLHIDSSVHQDIIEKILDWVGDVVADSLCDWTVFSVTVKITRTHTLFQCERCLILRALPESMEGEGLMVPATDLSIEKMLERVRVVVVCAEEDDDEEEEKYCWVREAETCMVCLEGYGAGSRASRMPCSHVFQDECIITWLKQSHYCPLCRFEMPTQKI